MRTTLILVPVLALTAAAGAPASGDVASLDAIISALYDANSVAAGRPLRKDRFRALFAPHARLTVVRDTGDGGVEPVSMTVDEFVTRRERTTTGFFESELARTTQTFGRIAHVWTTYEGRRDPSEKQPFVRGINSIQAMKTDGRWWITSVVWDTERPGSPIPPAYLPR